MLKTRMVLNKRCDFFELISSDLNVKVKELTVILALTIYIVSHTLDILACISMFS